MLIFHDTLLIIYAIIIFAFLYYSRDIFYKFYLFILLFWILVGIYLKFDYLTLLASVLITPFVYKKGNNLKYFFAATVIIFSGFVILKIPFVLLLYSLIFLLLNYFVLVRWKCILYTLFLSFSLILTNIILNTDSSTNYVLYKNTLIYLTVYIVLYLIDILKKIKTSHLHISNK